MSSLQRVKLVAEVTRAAVMLQD